MDTNDDRKLTIWVPADIHEALKRKATGEDQTMSQVVRRLLRDYVEVDRLDALEDVS